ncbi:MAG: hypothetical protein HY996_02850 [Micrococcales bacterium]|nr:hypothetical protein [Micrococcales bacterium]
MTIQDPRELDDDTLLTVTRALVVRDNDNEADLLEVLAEVDERRLYLPDHTSMFAFCTAELGFSEAVAENRITVARAGRRFPRVVAMRRSGAIHLSGLRLLSPHLTDDSADRLLSQATHKSKRQIEEIVACHAPKPPVADSIRKVPERRVAEPVAAEPGPLFDAPRPTAPAAPPPPPPAVVAPLAPERYHVQLTASRELRDQIEQATALLRHRVPNGDLATIFGLALGLLIDKVKKERFGVGRRPRSSKLPEGPAKGRDIPDAIKRAVYERDGGQCTFVGPNGSRCPERGFIELDHLDGFARRHEHVASRITLRCRAHNGYAAEVMYGPELMARKRRSAQAAQDARPRAPRRRDGEAGHQSPVRPVARAVGQDRSRPRASVPPGQLAPTAQGAFVPQSLATAPEPDSPSRGDLEARP